MLVVMQYVLVTLDILVLTVVPVYAMVITASTMVLAL
jgi:hypothetical protein